MKRREKAAGRAVLYAFFSFLLSNEPELKSINADKINFLKKLLRDSEGIPLLDASLGKKLDREQSESEAEIKADYISLFIAPGDRYVPPYESVYVDKDPLADRGLVMGPSTFKVKEFYAKAGLAPSKDFGELPDHIGLELAFMAFLCEKEAGAEDKDKAGEYLKLEKAFLEQHLIKWMEEYFALLCQKAGTRFYRAIALLAKDFIQSDFKYLASQR